MSKTQSLARVEWKCARYRPQFPACAIQYGVQNQLTSQLSIFGIYRTQWPRTDHRWRTRESRIEGCMTDALWVEWSRFHRRRCRYERERVWASSFKKSRWLWISGWKVGHVGFVRQLEWLWYRYSRDRKTDETVASAWEPSWRENLQGWGWLLLAPSSRGSIYLID